MTFQQVDRHIRKKRRLTILNESVGVFFEGISIPNDHRKADEKDDHHDDLEVKAGLGHERNACEGNWHRIKGRNN